MLFCSTHLVKFPSAIDKYAGFYVYFLPNYDTRFHRLVFFAFSGCSMDVQDFIRKLRRIEFHTRMRSKEALAGTYHSAFKGQGMTFSECKAYEDGDDVRYIDWHATARQNGVFVKQFIEERELSVSIILDLSAPMHFGSIGQLKVETAIEAMSILAFSALQNNDKVSLFLFSENGLKHIPPIKGKSNIVRIVLEALKFSPYTPDNSLSLILSKAATFLKRRNLVFIVSDFLHEGFDNPLQLLAHHHEVIPVVISDPMESKLPDLGFAIIQDLYDQSYAIGDTSNQRIRDAYAKNFEERSQRLKKLFNRLNLTTVRVSTTEDILPPILRAFNKRASHV